MCACVCERERESETDIAFECKMKGDEERESYSKKDIREKEKGSKEM